METTDVRAAAYEEVKHWLDAQVAAFYERYGHDWVSSLCGPFEEMRLLADEVFVASFDDFRPGRGTKFSTWLGYKVWKSMLSALRSAKRRPATGVELDTLPSPPRPAFRLDELTASLGDDAKAVVAIVLGETPPAVLRAVAGRDPMSYWRRPTPTTFRMAVKDYLLATGWTPTRVRKTFLEIREALP